MTALPRTADLGAKRSEHPQSAVSEGGARGPKRQFVSKRTLARLKPRSIHDALHNSAQRHPVATIDNRQSKQWRSCKFLL